MEFKFHEINGYKIAEVISNEVEINSLQDAVDLIANSDYQGARKIIINGKQLSLEFFELKTGLAGDILQKFVNYQMSLAVVGDFSKYKSKSLRDFIYESNKSGMIIFKESVENVLKIWTNSKS